MSALLYGLNAGLGFSPHTLGMVLKTIVSGRKNGLIFMLSGLALDILLIISVFFVQDSLEFGKSFQHLLQVLSGIVIVRMGIKAYRVRLDLPAFSKNTSSWREGFFLQLLNPNPYLFWFLIGVPYMISLKNNALALQFVIIFMFVTYGIKSLIVESCARAASGAIFKTRSFAFVRKGISVFTVLNGLYLILHNTKLIASI